jgi:hypothetical protein
MEMKLDDLLGFCAYYTLAKTAAKLSCSSQPPATKSAETPLGKSKVARKKFEGAEPKRSQKVVKPKMEYVSKVSKKSVSPIHREEFEEPREENKKKYDINYFVSHLASQNINHHNWPEPTRAREPEYNYQYPRKN